MGASTHSTAETNPTPDLAGIWERLDHLLEPETSSPQSPSPASKLVQFPSPRLEPMEQLAATVDLPALDATLAALLKLIAPDYSEGETLEALQQVVMVLNSAEGATLATQADIKRLTTLYEDLRGQVEALQTPTSPQPLPPIPEPTAAAPGLAMPSVIPPAESPDPESFIPESFIPEPLSITAPDPEALPNPEPLSITASDPEALPNPEPLSITASDPEALPNPEPLSITAPDPFQPLLESFRRRFSFSGRLSISPGFSFNRRQWLGLVVLALTLGAIAFYFPMIRPQKHLTAQLESALAADPNLSLYRIAPQVQGRRVILRGTVPYRELHQQIQTLIQALAPDYQIENQLMVVDEPVIATVNQWAATLNDLPGTMITAQFHSGQVILTGTTASQETEAIIIKRFAAIPGVIGVENLLQVQPLSLPTRFYFRHNQATVEPVDIQAKVIPVKNFLEKYPHLRVEIRGYSHRSEGEGDRYANADRLALQRAEAVQTALEDHGIDRRRLAVVRTGGLPANVAPNQDRWLHRTVAFTVVSDRPTGQH
ncbi:BON domain-containing protein [Spirulina sp. CCNP1310]|uniref:BON domain-containing protein n=1 Tax=Spirulina sp. CCNP1310 TaxID=3110249 RepID=UPI002B1F8126|nr:BON domain-containing protein [Spirulina sp. CCNP1310]MEA5418117.1 BON domain-containing protein [Spirulina sp. CCNP1310]